MLIPANADRSLSSGLGEGIPGSLLSPTCGRWRRWTPPAPERFPQGCGGPRPDGPRPATRPRALTHDRRWRHEGSRPRARAGRPSPNPGLAGGRRGILRSERREPGPNPRFHRQSKRSGPFLRSSARRGNRRPRCRGRPAGCWGSPRTSVRFCGLDGPMHQDRPQEPPRIISEPLDDNPETPKGFYLRRIDGILWLRGYRAETTSVWNSEDHLLFSRSSDSRKPRAGSVLCAGSSGRRERRQMAPTDSPAIAGLCGSATFGLGVPAFAGYLILRRASRRVEDGYALGRFFQIRTTQITEPSTR